MAEQQNRYGADDSFEGQVQQGRWGSTYMMDGGSAARRAEILKGVGLTEEQLTPDMVAQLNTIMGHAEAGEYTTYNDKLAGFNTTAPAALTQLNAEQKQQQLLSPYQERGDMALGQQEALLGLRGNDAMNAAYNENPAQAFARQQQEKAMVRNRAATGGLGDEGVQRELAQLTSGLTNQNIYNQVQQLGGLASRGYNAAQNIGNSYGQEGQIQAGQMYDTYGISQAEAAQRAAGNAAGSQRKLGMVSNAINLGSGLYTGGMSLFGGGGANAIPATSGGGGFNVSYDSTLANPYQYGG